MKACLIVVFWFAPVRVMAQEDWIVSPALRAAALEWLQAEDSTNALWAIGELAMGGDVMAQEFANTLYRTHVPFEFPDLSRAERLALFPNEDEFFRIYPYPGYPPDHPVKEARRAIGQAETPQDWISAAEILRDVGLVADFKASTRMAFGGNQDLIAIEAALYSDRLVDGTDAAQADIWMFRGIESMMQPYRADWNPDIYTRDLARWVEPPWSNDVAQELAQALDDGRWSAIRAFALLRSVSHSAQLTIDLPHRPDLAVIADLYTGLRNHSLQGPLNTSPQVLGALGDMLVQDAVDSAYLMPLFNVCSAACGESVSTCMAVGALNRFETSYDGAGRIEPVLYFDDYAASAHAAARLMSAITFYHSPDAMRPLAVPLPMCLVDAATE